MFEYFDLDLKEAVGNSIVKIAADFNFKTPKKVFPVLQITYRKMGKEETAPKNLQHLSRTVTLIDAEALIYLFKSGDEYYVLSLILNDEGITTDGRALGKYHEEILKRISPDIPMISVAYGNPDYSIDFTSANIKKLFFNPLDTQDEYHMDYRSQFRKKDILGFIKNYPAK